MLQKKFKKILVVNPYGLGDLLFTTPLLRTLREAYPESFIALLLGSRTKEIFENNRDVDKIYVFDKGKFDSLPKIKAFKMLFKLVKNLRKERFELLFDLSNSSQYGFIEKIFLNIPKRIGFNYRNRGRFLTDRIPLAGYKEKHVVEYYLDLARHLGLEPKDKSLKFPIKEEDISWAKSFLKENNISLSDNLVIGIVPAGGLSWGKDAFYKQWPLEKFVKLSDILSKESKVKVVVMGSKEEEDLCRKFLALAKIKPISSCGRTTIGRFAALCSLCNLVIANDGGPLHIAVSQKVPTISIFGPVDDKVYGPYAGESENYVVKKDLECRPCYQNFKFKPCKNRECLNSIEVKDVLTLTEKALNI